MADGELFIWRSLIKGSMFATGPSAIPGLKR
jgi:hypothetical protein